MMQDAPEEIIIIEESDVNSDLDDAQDGVDESGGGDKKKLFIYLGIGFLAILLVAIVLFFVFKSDPIEQQTNFSDSIEDKLEKQSDKPIKKSNLEKMIAKANYLYSNGSKDDALFLYEKIAIYSEAISMYNLGVAQLKDKNYELALQTFQKAIQNDEKRCVSAINAAVCSLHLKDNKSFKYYIDLAYAYLPHERNSPLYSYYYALISYYNNNYLEALSALNNPTSDEYPDVQKHLKTKIDALFDNNYKAIDTLDKNFLEDDAFSIALLYARIGDLTLALNHLEESVRKNIQPVRSVLAQVFINLKMGRVSTAARLLTNVTDMFPNEVYKPYPIRVKLKESLVEPEQAQFRYRDEVKNSKMMKYQKIFYFSPYKIFNADKTISSIQKGNANIYVDNFSSAKGYLKKSAVSSKVNRGIVKAIKKALSFKLRDANSELQKLIKIQPKHSILQYNLALTYAQMGDMTKAHKHFLLSFHLDAKNYLSGVFAIMTSQLIGKDSTSLTSILKESLAIEDNNEEMNLYKTLINISKDDILAVADWIDNDYEQKPLYLMLDNIIAIALNNKKVAKKASHKLTLLLPTEILPHIIYMETHFADFKPKKYARKVLNYLKNQKFNYKDFYYGPYITRDLYIQQNLITGRLYFLRQQLKDVLETTTKNTDDITSALALASLYDKAYEESYTLYNHLIDELRVRDARTLFLGAVASTAATHHANAIALLELSKIKDGSFLQSRYALGLLYLEVKNNKGAVIQFERVGNDGFKSDYFDFEIDQERLLIDKQKNRDIISQKMKPKGKV